MILDRLCVSCSFGVLLAGFAVGQQQPKRDFGLMPDLPPILKKAVESAPKIRYSGLRTVEFREGPDREKYSETVIKDGSRSRSEIGTGSKNAGQIIVEDGEQRLHFFPDLNEIHVLPLQREEALSRLMRFLRPGPRKLELSVEDGVKVAGIETKSVSVKDKDGNVITRLWIDPESGMILKRELYDPVGAVVGGFEFTRINFRPNIREDDFKIDRRGAKRLTLSDILQKLCEQNDYLVVKIPTGEPYVLENVRMLTHGPQPVLAQFYRSKIGPISLFQVKCTVDEKIMQRMARPNTSTATWSIKGRSFALVGEVGKAELDRLAAKIKLQQ